MMWVEVTYAQSEPSGQWVPATMNEWATSPGLARVSGTATYTNFRRFVVDTTQTFADPRTTMK